MNEDIIADYSEVEQNRLKKLSELKKDRGSTTPELHTGTFALMLMVAVLIDIIDLLLNLTVVGGFIEDFTLAPLAIMVFWIWFKMSGVNFTKGYRGVVTAIVAFAGFIPFVNALPRWTAEVLMVKAGSKIERVAKDVLKK